MERPTVEEELFRAQWWPQKGYLGRPASLQRSSYLRIPGVGVEEEALQWDSGDPQIL